MMGRALLFCLCVAAAGGCGALVFIGDWPMISRALYATGAMAWTYNAYSVARQ
jgi:hypothetical protein